MKWIKPTERLPEVNDLYHANIRMKDTDLDTFPATVNYFKSHGWEISDDYEVVEWLDEYEPEIISAADGLCDKCGLPKEFIDYGTWYESCKCEE